MQWLLLGFTACILLLIPVALFEGSVPGVHYGLTVAFGLIPLAIAIAVVRQGLFDVELVVNRAVVYGALTAAGLAAYAALLAGTGARAGTGPYAPLLATAIAAALTAARSRFQRFVDGRLFGARRDPYEVVRRVGVSVAAAEAPDEALANKHRRSLLLLSGGQRRDGIGDEVGHDAKHSGTDAPPGPAVGQHGRWQVRSRVLFGYFHEFLLGCSVAVTRAFRLAVPGRSGRCPAPSGFAAGSLPKM